MHGTERPFQCSRDDMCTSQRWEWIHQHRAHLPSLRSACSFNGSLYPPALRVHRYHGAPSPHTFECVTSSAFKFFNKPRKLSLILTRTYFKHSKKKSPLLGEPDTYIPAWGLTPPYPEYHWQQQQSQPCLTASCSTHTVPVTSHSSPSRSFLLPSYEVAIRRY